MAIKTERLNVRLTHAQDVILRQAAAAKGEPVSDYVIRHAVQAAENDLADRRIFVADEAAWRQLQDVLNGPQRPAVELRRHIEEASAIDEQ
jgi:uncharacterized protein (DUF1778 family)